MKKKLMILLFLSISLVLGACGNHGNITEKKTSDGNMTEDEAALERAEDMMESAEMTQKSRVLIAYYSQPTEVDISDLDALTSASVVVRDGETKGSTTEYVATLIQETVGGDLFRIETVEEYPTDYDELVAQAREEKQKDFRPNLVRHIENLEQYDTIILGFPSWITDMPMPVYSFLEEYDFGAKTIIPFVTHGGSGFGGTREAISKLQPGAFVSDKALSIARDDLAGSEEEIRQWAESLGLHTNSQISEFCGQLSAASL